MSSQGYHGVSSVDMNCVYILHLRTGDHYLILFRLFEAAQHFALFKSNSGLFLFCPLAGLAG